ncbi:glycyl radical protein [Candidatus Aerophobetes bacterium]|nr:glycyl radical protein [Candidatus Aerophobetes bacterium]
MFDRISRIRKNLLATQPRICAERALLITESYKKTEGLPIVLRRAYALEKILEKMSIYIENDQLIVGNQASTPRAAPIFPEYSVNWIEKELDTFDKRSGDVFLIDEDTKEQLRSIFKYWKGKTHEDEVLRNFPEEVKLAEKVGAIHPGGITHTGDGHIIVNYKKILNQGFRGIIREAEEILNTLDLTNPDDVRKMDFLQSVSIALRAAIKFAKRYAEKAKELAKEENNPRRKRELEKIAQICSWVPENAPRTFYEALQTVFFVHLIIQIESNGHSVSLGRFDQYLYPFYKEDTKKGILNKEEALELIACFFLKLNTINKVRPWSHTQFGVGYATYQNLVIGGVTPQGEDGTNELSYLCLEADKKVRLPQPNLSARYHDGCPMNFLIECAKLIRMGFGMPAMFNDEVIVPALLNIGVPVEDARDYAMVGCVTPVVPGKWNHRPTGMTFLNLGKILELALNNGKDPRTGIQLCPGNGDLKTFNSFEDVWKAWEKQLKFFTRLHIVADNICDLSLEKHDSDPFCSAFIDDCIKRGKTAKQGGAIYDFTSGLLTGASTVGDSLAVIKKLVFEDKVVDAQELKEAMDRNWEGEKANKIRNMVLKVPKFGNDSDYVDSLVVKVYESYFKLIPNYRTTRYGQGPIGCRWTPSTATISANTPFGGEVGATPDGRKAGEPLNEGASPFHGADQNGPTAAIKSVAKLPNVLMAGGQLLNLKFSPSALSGENNLRKFVSLLKTFFDLKGFHVQFNVVSAEILKDAQKHPERYQDLIVRVAAYCALFVTLDPAVQNDIIARTEHEMIT